MVWFYEIFPVKWINRSIQKKLIRLVQPKDGSRILDAGCGTGSFLEELKKNDDKFELFGIDVSDGMVQRARRRLGKDDNVSKIAVEEIKFIGKFDYIFSIDSFHHYADQERAMEKFSSALKKGGELVVLDFSFGRIGNWIFRHFEPGKSKMFSRAEFREMFRNEGFEDIQQRRMGLFSILTRGRK